MKKLNIQITLTGLIVIMMYSVGITQNWTQQSTSTNMHNWMYVLHTDIDHNVYCEIPYADTVVISDTSFSHSAHTWQNAAISVYNSDGGFIRAFDFHTLPMSFIYSTYVTTDLDLNIYVSGAFGIRLFIQDTVINHGPGPNPDAPGVFLLKINEGNKVEWAKLIYSENQDRCFGLFRSNNNFLYMAVSHGGHGTVNYLDQDTVDFDRSLYGILKLSMDGQIIWRKNFHCPTNFLSLRNFFIDEDENVYLDGYTRGDIVVETDTLTMPETTDSPYPDFLIKFNEDGNLVFGNIVNNDIGFYDLKPAPNDELFFTASLGNDTVVFGHDTIIIAENNIAKLVGRIDYNFQPVWYHILEAMSTEVSSNFIIDYLRDTLYSAIAGKRQQTFVGTEYDFGFRTSTLLVPFDVNGIPGVGKVLKATYNRMPSILKLDECNNLLMSGRFRGEGWFGDDTLHSFHPYYDDGFISKFNYSANQSIDIGSDTAIGWSHSISIGAPDGYENYYWSTGFEGQVLNLVGTEIDTGYHKIWCDAMIGKCVVSDTLLLTVYDDTSVEEINIFSAKVYPNPFSETINFQYTLTEPMEVELIIYNLLGEKIEVIKAMQSGGANKIEWIPVNFHQGIYFYRLKAGNEFVCGKLIYTP